MTVESILPVIRAALGLVAAGAVLALALEGRRKGAPITSLGLVARSHAPSFEAQGRITSQRT